MAVSCAWPGANGEHTGTYTMSVTGYADAHAARMHTTGTVAVDGSAQGEIEVSHDRDWFAMKLEEGKVCQIDVKGSSRGDGILRDPSVERIHNTDGSGIINTGNSIGGTGRKARQISYPEEDGTYYLAAGACDCSQGTYQISIEEVM